MSLYGWWAVEAVVCFVGAAVISFYLSRWMNR